MTKTKVIGYMCATDWQHEIGDAPEGNVIYPSIDELKKRRACVIQCGIVEVEVLFRKVAVQGWFELDTAKDRKKYSRRLCPRIRVSRCEGVRMKNLKSQRFGKLLVEGYSESDKWNHSLWLCKCDCGNAVRRTARVLTSGKSFSCGCQRRTLGQPVIEMVGKKFGRLEVKEFVERGRCGAFYWKCVCECGGEKIVNGTHLRHNAIRSCGCLHKEVIRQCGPKPKRQPSAPKVKRGYRKIDVDRGYYRVNSRPHERALAAAGKSFA